MHIRVLFWFVFCLGLPVVAQAKQIERVSVEKVVDGLNHPWSMVFLPNGETLISERGGKLRRLHNGKLSTVIGLPKLPEVGQGGLMGLVLHPKFSENRWLYFAHVGGNRKHGYNTHVSRARYHKGKLSELQTIFRAQPKVSGGRHFGGRLLFDKQGFLFISLGDRGQRELAQQLSNHSGSLIRLNADGSIPPSNPFVGHQGAAAEIYSYGQRNIQGLSLHPKTGAVWAHEHGPRGGDEINLIKAGANYGWPLITYGREYWGGKVGKGLKKQAGLMQPVWYWVPSIAPSGMSFYTGDKYPSWQGKLFVGSLKFGELVMLETTATGVSKEARFLGDKIGRIRDVKEGPDGFLYVLTDASNGALYRLKKE